MIEFSFRSIQWRNFKGLQEGVGAGVQGGGGLIIAGRRGRVRRWSKSVRIILLAKGLSLVNSSGCADWFIHLLAVMSSFFYLTKYYWLTESMYNLLIVLKIIKQRSVK